MNRQSTPSSIKKLKQKWGTFYKTQKYLKSVSIKGPVGLRGINDSTMELKGPVSVLCGTNGAGKTTFLALSCLAFHSNMKPIFLPSRSSYYEFKHFFVPVSRDPQPEGITVSWTYTDGSHDTIKKGRQRWMRYMRKGGVPRRPTRGTEFVGISRITPAFERKNYASYFTRKKGITETDFSNIMEYMSRILSKPYSSLKELAYTNTSGQFRSRYYNSTHTSFNAGAGEECLFSILQSLISSPNGSFIAIEEIEIGLHPSTLNVLVECILEIAENRQLQVVITSHSPEFLRACPSEIVIMAERSGKEVTFTHNPNIEYAISKLGGQAAKQIAILCEDEFAGHIISALLPRECKSIATICSYGSKDVLIDKANALKPFNDKTKIVIIWDGDVSDRYLVNAAQNGFLGLKLPGDTSPESVIIKHMSDQRVKDHIMDHHELSISDYEKLINRLVAASDHHDVEFIICDEIGIKESDLPMFLRQIIKCNITEFANVVSEIKHISEISLSEFVKHVNSKNISIGGHVASAA